ncbi:MAG: PAS domain S-box protein [Desulfobacteraceae bacterium]
MNDNKKELQEMRRRLREAEEELESLRMRNLFLNSVFDGISEEILVLDKDFNVLDVNQVMVEHYGLEKGKVLGRKCYELKAEAGAPCGSQAGEGCPLVKAKETGERMQMSLRHTGSDGRPRELSLIMYPITRSEGDPPEYFMEITRDETKYHSLISELRTSRRRFRSILDTATAAILSIDENHRIILFNNAAERIFGYSRDEVLGRDLNILIPTKYGDHSRYVKRFLQTRQGRVIGRTVNLTAVRKGGEEFPIELSLSFLEMDPEVTFTAVIRDLTDRRRLEKKLLQSERLAAVGEAVAHVVHELKNPLMIIGGFTSQIRRYLEDERLTQKLDLILEEVTRVERLVAGLGDFTKDYRLILRRADVNSVLRDVVKVMAGAYPPGRYGFRENLDPNLEEITCDPDKLKQVFINIIANGMEAMSEGGVITLTTASTSTGIEIRISDEGLGIPDEDLQHIFEPFYTTRERGSGLGLSISYKIVQAHGGDLSAVSRPGKGTTFIIRLPRE